MSFFSGCGNEGSFLVFITMGSLLYGDANSLKEIEASSMQLFDDEVTRSNNKHFDTLFARNLTANTLNVGDGGTISGGLNVIGSLLVNGSSAIGAQGPAGPAGPAGATGPQGPTGPTGATGATGPALGYGWMWNTVGSLIAATDPITLPQSSSFLNMSAGLNGIVVAPAHGAASGIYIIQFFVVGKNVNTNNSNVAIGVAVDNVSQATFGTQNALTGNGTVNGTIILSINAGQTITLVNRSGAGLQTPTNIGEPFINASLVVMQIA